MQKIRSFVKDSSAIPFMLFLAVTAAGVAVILSFSLGMMNYDLWDYIEGVFWADATVKAGAVINPEYIYYYVLPFGSNIIMAPFVKIFGTSFLANQLGMIVFFVIYASLSFRLARSLYPGDTRSRLFFVSILSLFIFTYVGDNLLHHLLTYGIAFVCLIGEISCIIGIDRNDRSAGDWLLLIILCLWSALNGFSVVLSTVPVIAAFSVISFRNGAFFRRQSIRLILVMTAISAAGLAVFLYYDKTALTQDMYQSRFVLDDVGNVVENTVIDLLTDYLICFNYTPSRDAVFSVLGVYYLIKIMFAAAVALVPVILLFSDKDEEQQNDPHVSLLMLSNLFVMAVCLAEYILMESSVLRYLFNFILSLFMICAWAITKHIKEKNSYLTIFALFALVILMTAKTVLYTVPGGSSVQERFERVNDVIQEEGLSRGYVCNRAWKALDLISEGGCYNTTININCMSGQIYVENDRIYLYETEKPEEVDRFYILVDDERYDSYSDWITGWIRCRVVEDAYIYVFDIDSWDQIFGGTENG